jgi:hypothetical protein
LNYVLQSQHIRTENVLDANIRCVAFLCNHTDMLPWRHHASLKVDECGTQNYLVFGLFPSSRILVNRKHDVLETGSVSVLR